jgi:hypothetical protein
MHINKLNSRNFSKNPCDPSYSPCCLLLTCSSVSKLQFNQVLRFCSKEMNSNQQTGKFHMLNLANSLIIFILIALFIEILISRRIWRKGRRQKTFNNFTKQRLLLVFMQPNQNQGQSQPLFNNEKINPSLQPRVQEIILPSTRYSPYSKSWSQFAYYACIFSIFCITFLIINYLLRPYTYQWSLIFLPVLLPLPFLTVPYLFELKTYSTLLLLFIGLGIGFFLFFIL